MRFRRLRFLLFSFALWRALLLRFDFRGPFDSIRNMTRLLEARDARGGPGPYTTGGGLARRAWYRGPVLARDGLRVARRSALPRTVLP